MKYFLKGQIGSLMAYGRPGASMNGTAPVNRYAACKAGRSYSPRAFEAGGYNVMVLLFLAGA
jgi:hypothetical protein